MLRGELNHENEKKKILFTSTVVLKKKTVTMIDILFSLRFEENRHLGAGRLPAVGPRQSGSRRSRRQKGRRTRSSNGEDVQGGPRVSTLGPGPIERIVLGSGILAIESAVSYVATRAK